MTLPVYSIQTADVRPPLEVRLRWALQTMEQEHWHRSEDGPKRFAWEAVADALDDLQFKEG